MLLGEGGEKEEWKNEKGKDKKAEGRLKREGRRKKRQKGEEREGRTQKPEE